MQPLASYAYGRRLEIDVKHTYKDTPRTDHRGYLTLIATLTHGCVYPIIHILSQLESQRL